LSNTTSSNIVAGIAMI